MPGRVAIAMAAQSGGAGGGELHPRTAREQQRVRLGRRTKLPQSSVVDGEQYALRLTCIGDGATEEVGRGTAMPWLSGHRYCRYYQRGRRKADPHGEIRSQAGRMA
jgi:hypothetical protein